MSKIVCSIVVPERMKVWSSFFKANSVESVYRLRLNFQQCIAIAMENFFESRYK